MMPSTSFRRKAGIIMPGGPDLGFRRDDDKSGARNRRAVRRGPGHDKYRRWAGAYSAIACIPAVSRGAKTRTSRRARVLRHLLAHTVELPRTRLEGGDHAAYRLVE